MSQPELSGQVKPQPELSGQVKLSSDVYFDATNTIRHYDTQRASFASFAASALTLLVGFVTIQNKAQVGVFAVRIVSLLIIFFSAACFLFSLKIDRLIRRHRARARFAATLLKEQGIDAISAIDTRLESIQRAKVDSIRIGQIWATFFFFFIAAGLMCFIFADRLRE